MVQFGICMSENNSPHRSARSFEEFSWSLLRLEWVEALLALFSVRGGFVGGELSRYEQAHCDDGDL